LLEFDGLKAVKDRWDHAAGDAVLVHLVSVLTRNLDPLDGRRAGATTSSCRC
jgi:GGDEF domain-containing protein